MEKFIAQKDEVCKFCGNEIPRGAWIYLIDDDVICQDCNEDN